MNVQPTTIHPAADQPDTAMVVPTVRRVNAELVFAAAHGKTFLKRQLTPHPFHITRPFYFSETPSGIASLYLQSSSGGLYGDDHLTLDVTVKKDAAAHVTTQASTVVHAARGGETYNRVNLSVERGAFLEYLPDPVILFSEARLRADLEITLADDSTLILADAFLNHDPDAGQAGFDRYVNTISAMRYGTPDAFLIDRMEIEGKDWPCPGPAFAAGFRCHGTLYVFTPEDLQDAGTAIRSRLNSIESCEPCRSFAGVEVLPDKNALCVRILCVDGAHLHTLLTEAAEAARIAVTGSSPARRPK